MARRRAPLSDGFDTIGPFHPYIALAGVLLFDLALILMVLGAFTLIGDKVEDMIWPGGPEWVDL